MSSRHLPDPLDNEERELALRLARLGAPAEPGPSLDAKILAAAHTAAARRPASRMQRRRRWPVAFGVAASLALAVGVAWQSRPLPQGPVYEEAASAAMDAAATAGGPSADAGSISAPVPMMAPPSPVESMERRQPSEQKEAAAQAKAVAADHNEASDGAAAAQAPIVFDTPLPIEPVAPPSPPPPPPAATSASPEFVSAPPATSTPPMEPRTRAEQAARASNMQSRPAPAPKPRDAATNDVLSDAAAAAEASDEAFDERPPNTADAPEVRQAWLQRIRELIASGDTSAARESLQEFKRRYPGIALPEDLRRFDLAP